MAHIFLNDRLFVVVISFHLSTRTGSISCLLSLIVLADSANKISSKQGSVHWNQHISHHICFSHIKHQLSQASNIRHVLHKVMQWLSKQLTSTQTIISTINPQSSQSVKASHAYLRSKTTLLYMHKLVYKNGWDTKAWIRARNEMVTGA